MGTHESADQKVYMARLDGGMASPVTASGLGVEQSEVFRE